LRQARYGYGALTCPWCKEEFSLTFGAPANAGPLHFAIDCPKCHARFKFAKTLLGKLGVCPSCKEHVKLDADPANVDSGARVPERKVPTRDEWREAVSEAAAQVPKRNEPTGAGSRSTFPVPAAQSPKHNEPTRRAYNWLWPSVQTLECAEKATRNAFYWAIVSTAITGWLSFLAICGVQWVLDAGVEPWTLIDASALAVIAVGLYRHSRFAALAGLVLCMLGLVLYMLDRVVMLSEGGFPPANYKLVSALFFTLIFLGGVRGAFAYHRLKRAATQEPTSQELPVSLDSVAADTERDRVSDEQASDDPADAQLSAGQQGKAETVMTPLRSVIVFVGILAIVGAGVYLPWQWKSPYTGHLVQIAQGESSYGWLWSPPVMTFSSGTRCPPVVDWSRLLVEWFLIGAVTAVLAWVIPVLHKAACRAKNH
jgi:hypothetical protein